MNTKEIFNVIENPLIQWERISDYRCVNILYDERYYFNFCLYSDQVNKPHISILVDDMKLGKRIFEKYYTESSPELFRILRENYNRALSNSKNLSLSEAMGV